MKQEFHISTQTTKNYIDNNDVALLALYLKLKSLYSKTIIYNYSIKSLSEKSGVSYYLLSKYVPRMMDCGLVSYSKGNLIITSFKKINEKSKSKITINTNSKLSDIIFQIRAKYIKSDLLRQKFVIDLHHNRKKTSYRKLKRLMKKYPESGDKNIHTSYRRISSLLNLSLSRAHSLTKRMIEDGYFKLKTDIKVIKEYTNERMSPVVTKNGLLMTKNHQLILISSSIAFGL